MSHASCPWCGYHLAGERAFSAGSFGYDRWHGFRVDGRRLDARPQAHELLGAVMAANGRPVSREVIAIRLGSQSERPGATVSVLLHRVRRSFAALGRACPVETVRDVGLRWCGPAVTSGRP